MIEIAGPRFDAVFGCLHVPLLLCCCLCITIAIAIAESCWCFGCTWRKGRVGNALDRGCVDVVVDDKELLRETSKHALDCNCN